MGLFELIDIREVRHLRFPTNAEVEIENFDKPALVAQWIGVSTYQKVGAKCPINYFDVASKWLKLTLINFLDPQGIPPILVSPTQPFSRNPTKEICSS